MRPYFTDAATASALGRMGACCIVVDKRQQTDSAIKVLAAAENSLSSAYLDGFEELSLPDAQGRGFVMHPYSGMPDPVDLGPVRVAGWSKSSTGRLLPTPHAKLLVLGVTTY